MDKQWTIEELEEWIDAPAEKRVGRVISQPPGYRYPPSHRELLSMIVQVMRKQDEIIVGLASVDARLSNLSSKVEPLGPQRFG